MTKAAEKLKSQLLHLASEDRAELAYVLIRSLDEAADPGVQAAWDAELERRWQEMESGEAAGVPPEEVLAELPKKYP